MITQEQADYMVKLPKLITCKDEYFESKSYRLDMPIIMRFEMASKIDDNYAFVAEIKQSGKNQFKMSLHFRDSGVNIGLLRLDFGGKHTNPADVTENLPKVFASYAGRRIEENHVHYFIEGYKNLAWAIPLSKDESISIKSFSEHRDIVSIINTFVNKINLKTILDISIQPRTI